MSVINRLKNLLYRKSKTPYSFDTWEMEAKDSAHLRSQTYIALDDYAKSGYTHRGALDNLLGVVGEFAFDGFLDKSGLKRDTDYEWIKRKFNYWKNGADTRPYDFKLKKGSEIAFEIATTRPPPYHLAMMTDTEHKKKSKYFVQVQINLFRLHDTIGGKWLLLDAKEKEAKELSPEEIESLEPEKTDIIGEAVIKGFDETAKILAKENGWAYSPKGARNTPTHAAFIKELAYLEPLSKLQKIIYEDLNFKPQGKNSEQSPLF